MTGIRKRKNPSGSIAYQAQVRVRGSKPISKTFKRLTDAKAWKSAVETDIKRGLHLPTSTICKITVSELIDRYLKETLPLRRSKQSVIRTLNWWEERVGHLTLSKLSTRVIKEHWDELSRTPSKKTKALLSNRSMNWYLETFNAMLQNDLRQFSGH